MPSREDDKADLGADYLADGAELVDCPNCREPKYEDAERCPRCGYYITEEENPGKRHPWWIILGAILCLASSLIWIFW